MPDRSSHACLGLLICVLVLVGLGQPARAASEDTAAGASPYAELEPHVEDALELVPDGEVNLEALELALELAVDEVPIEEVVATDGEVNLDTAGQGLATVVPADVAVLPAAVPTEVQVAPVPQKTGLISLDFQDADIQNVLRIFSEKSGVNVIAGTEVEGIVTIRLRDVPWEQALDILLKTYGFTYERNDNVIRVTTFEQMRLEELETSVFVLNYADAATVVTSLTDVLTERGSVQADPRTNTLVVRDIPTNLYRLGQVVERLDRRTPQVAIDTRIVETTLDRDENLGIDWTMKVTVAGANRPSTLPFDATTGLGTVNRLLPRIDPSDDNFPQLPSIIKEGRFPFATTGNFTFGRLDFSSFSAVMEFLKTRTDTTIVSNPRIITLNNQKAAIHVGQVFNVPSFERNPSTGAFEVTGFEERDIGINLVVTPHVNVAQEIVVDIHPEVTEFTGFDTFSGDLQAPRFDTREAETQVRVNPGDTIAIGGLVKEKLIDVERKMPILGDLPIVGAAFRKTEQAKDKTDLLFFITVTLVDERSTGISGDDGGGGTYATTPLRN